MVWIESNVWPAPGDHQPDASSRRLNRVASGRRRFTRCSATPSSTTSTRRPGLPMSSAGSRRLPKAGSTNSSPGTGFKSRSAIKPRRPPRPKQIKPKRPRRLNSSYIPLRSLADGYFSLLTGLTNNNMIESGVKRTMVASAKRIVALLDSSKLGRESTYPFADRGDVIVTGEGVHSSTAQAIRDRGIELIIAPLLPA